MAAEEFLPVLAHHQCVDRRRGMTQLRHGDEAAIGFRKARLAEQGHRFRILDCNPSRRLATGSLRWSGMERNQGDKLQQDAPMGATMPDEIRLVPVRGFAVLSHVFWQGGG